MANAKNVAAVIDAAHNEIGMTGKLNVSIDRQEATKSLNATSLDEFHIDVRIEDLKVRIAESTKS